MRAFAVAIILSAPIMAASVASADESHAQLYLTIGGEGRGATAATLTFPSREACKKAAMEQLNEHIPSAGVDGRATCIDDDGGTFYAARCGWWGLEEKWTRNARVVSESGDKQWKMSCGYRNELQSH
jgi:hypothetical protein